MSIIATAFTAFWSCCRLGELFIDSVNSFNPTRHVSHNTPLHHGLTPTVFPFIVLTIPWTKMLHTEGASIVTSATFLETYLSLLLRQILLQEHLDAWAPTIFLLILLVSVLASHPYPNLTLIILVILAFPFALYLSLQQSQYIWPDSFSDKAYPCSVSPID
ncbi:uncharacterized protein EDB93DRAFT_1253368 [Suillus bovinus]|uniref:uncharacterized protein n=1 Tax=Suillus bovinus TaxID=48563 RepID=UPI001B86582E|nr:uncharacterized protein EDB93DRAFT_1253368 [Suillus bovinus]KAG2138406.1 hypothetical protein EDB93DRAFT_1253368 [Suillus bovinus]